MSSDEERKTLIALYESGYNIGCTVTATSVFHIYDYILNFRREASVFWRRPFSVAGSLYFFNRYSCLARAVYYLYATFVPPPASYKSCVVQWYLSVALDLMPLLSVAVFSSLRTYALTQRAVVAAVVLVLSLAPFLVNWIGHTWHTWFEFDDITGCLINIPGDTDHAKIFATASRLPLILSDLIVVIVTWIKTYQVGTSSRLLGAQSLSSVMFKNGNFYAITLFLLNSVHWTLTMLSLFGAENETGYSSLFSRFVDPVSGVLVSHFLLDLQEAAASHSHQHSHDSASSIYFNGPLGSLSSSLPGPLELQPAIGGHAYETDWPEEIEQTESRSGHDEFAFT